MVIETPLLRESKELCSGHQGTHHHHKDQFNNTVNQYSVETKGKAKGLSTMKMMDQQLLNHAHLVVQVALTKEDHVGIPVQWLAVSYSINKVEEIKLPNNGS